MSHNNFQPHEMNTRKGDFVDLLIGFGSAILGVILAILLVDCTPLGKAIRALMGF